MLHKEKPYNESLAMKISKRFKELHSEDMQVAFAGGIERLKNRVEIVRVVNEVLYLNDSASFNLNAAWYALEYITRPTIWIMDGEQEYNYSDLTSLDEVVQEKVKILICLGRNNRQVITHFSPYVKSIVETTTIKMAVKYAKYFAEKHDVVLFSPASAKSELMGSYNDRTNEFLKQIQEL